MAEKIVQLEVSGAAPAAMSDRELRPDRPEVVRIALLGNPNTGKTTLFNRISGLRHKTSNFPGTTLEARVTRVKAGVEGGRDGDLIDLPGIYSIELDQLESRVCREVLAGSAAPTGEPLGSPEVVVVVVDATNLGRNLMLVGEVMRRRLPTVIVVNMMDLAARQGLGIDVAALGAGLGCEVVRTNARAGEGIDDLRLAIRRAKIPAPAIAVPPTTDALRAWADQMYLKAASEPEPLYGLKESVSDRVDRVLLHPLGGSAVFALIMAGLFYTIFSLAQFPMAWIDAIFSGHDTWVRAWQPGWLQTLISHGLTGLINANLPEGILRDLLANGVVAGVGSTLVFLPQICLLFFLICLLEDTGYLARASFVMDRVLRPFGLPGNAFVPLLSSHACALPGILATRGIPDLKQRLATILVAPFMTCSARLPVYVLLTSLLFAGRPAMAALAFVGCYALGMAAGVFSALIARRTILRGHARPMAMELPSYKRPSIRTALATTFDRGFVFLKNAGTVILAISVVMWWLGAYPKVAPTAEVLALRQLADAAESRLLGQTPDKGDGAISAVSVPTGFLQTPEEMRAQAAELRQNADDLMRQVQENPERIATLHREADRLDALAQTFGRHAWRLDGGMRPEVPLEVRAEADQLEAINQKTHSFMGRIGRTVQPVFSPMDWDWRVCIGVMASCVAREVFVSTMSVVIAGEENDDTEDKGLIANMANARRDDGVTPVFTPRVSWSLLVFYVLAMQCLATLVLTAKEAGGKKWALLQFGWMSMLAYAGAFITYHVAG